MCEGLWCTPALNSSTPATLCTCTTRHGDREGMTQKESAEFQAAQKSMTTCESILVAYTTKIARSEGRTQARSGSLRRTRTRRVDGRLVGLVSYLSWLVLRLSGPKHDFIQRTTAFDVLLVKYDCYRLSRNGQAMTQGHIKTPAECRNTKSMLRQTVSRGPTVKRGSGTWKTAVACVQ
jgi:hypothetical protein